jgi:hypothetical protein
VRPRVFRPPPLHVCVFPVVQAAGERHGAVCYGAVASADAHHARGPGVREHAPPAGVLLCAGGRLL